MSTNEPAAEQSETRKCANCGELPNHHAIAGRICKRQMYYRPEAEPSALPEIVCNNRCEYVESNVS